MLSYDNKCKFSVVKITIPNMRALCWNKKHIITKTLVKLLPVSAFNVEVFQLVFNYCIVSQRLFAWIKYDLLNERKCKWIEFESFINEMQLTFFIRLTVKYIYIDLKAINSIQNHEIIFSYLVRLAMVGWLDGRRSESDERRCRGKGGRRCGSGARCSSDSSLLNISYHLDKKKKEKTRGTIHANCIL